MIYGALRMEPSRGKKRPTFRIDGPRRGDAASLSSSSIAVIIPPGCLRGCVSLGALPERFRFEAARGGTHLGGKPRGQLPEYAIEGRS
jgi:hypothetical protein